jgi:peptidoglycan/xylan/chitin deacetylase (PgdA/CDA1 family)
VKRGSSGRSTRRSESPNGAILHSIAGPPGSALSRWLDGTPNPYGLLSPLVGPFSRPIVRVSGPDSLLERAARSLPEGAARAEAIAVRLRRTGLELSWGAPEELPDTAAFIRWCYARGASSIELMRADYSLLTELQIGAFFHAYWRRRVIRHAACRLRLLGSLVRNSHRLLGMASDIAFWLGVRSVATDLEWERLTRSSYIVFYYHGIKDGAEAEHSHLHVRPCRFDAQLRWLRVLGFRALSPGELLSFHSDPRATLPRRSFVIAADDGFRNTVEVFRRHARLHPQVFVNTSSVGGTASWAYNEPLASWRELEELHAAGGVVVSHGRGHPVMPQLEPDALEDELAGALADIEAQLEDVPPLLAYPYGEHDERVRSAAAIAGYRAAFTIKPGPNGAGTDSYCLRRLGVLDWDGHFAFLWKALTGELLPRVWERRRRRRRAAGLGRARQLERDTVR